MREDTVFLEYLRRDLCDCMIGEMCDYIVRGIVEGGIFATTIAQG